MEHMYDVFISYSSKDQKIVEAMCHYLEERNLRCFVAYRDVPKGGYWGKYISPAIKKSKVFIYVHTSTANESEDTTREIVLALKCKLIIVPFRLENIEYSDGKEYSLTNLNWLDAFPGDPETYFENLYDIIKVNLSDQLSYEVKDKEKYFLLNYKLLLNYFFGVLIIIMILVFYIKSKEPILLIAGGGSARNYIERYDNIKLEDYPSSYYVHMPTSNAWLLLTEEVISPQKEPKYYPICVSASTAEESDFLKITTREHFLKYGSVVEMTLGYDTLAVYVKKNEYVLGMIDLKNYATQDISLDELSKLISNHDSINIFATSPGSGTRTTYDKLLTKMGVVLDDHCFNQFSEYSDLATINKNDLPYLLLGSKCYTMGDLEKIVSVGDAQELKVFETIDGRKKYICKDINLYFMAYKKYNTNDLYIPQQTIKFLHGLGCDLGNKVKNNMIKMYTTESVILEFEKLPDL